MPKTLVPWKQLANSIETPNLQGQLFQLFVQNFSVIHFHGANLRKQGQEPHGILLVETIPLHLQQRLEETPKKCQVTLLGKATTIGGRRVKEITPVTSTCSAEVIGMVEHLDGCFLGANLECQDEKRERKYS